MRDRFGHGDAGVPDAGACDHRRCQPIRHSTKRATTKRRWRRIAVVVRWPGPVLAATLLALDRTARLAEIPDHITSATTSPARRRYPTRLPRIRPVTFP